MTRELLGFGRHRNVYAIDKDKAIKIAKDNLGILQNKCEFNVSGVSDFVAKVFLIDNKGHSIVVERAEKCTEKIFEELTYIDFSKFKKIVELKESILNEKNQDRIIKNSVMLDVFYKKYKLNNFLNNFFKLLKVYNYGGCIGDFKKISSYGIIREKIVPIDYGFYKI
ncbi:MAG: hypothetical protein EBU90_21575 [Proteobacteria bacterium]|nr:hypothetical protein [Pseudomonadota bacterium]